MIHCSVKSKHLKGQEEIIKFGHYQINEDSILCKQYGSSDHSTVHAYIVVVNIVPFVSSEDYKGLW